MRKNVDANSKAEGRQRSRLPQWDSETIAYIRGKCSKQIHGNNISTDSKI